MEKHEIVRFLKDNIEPIDDYIYGKGYRASVYLTDGTFLPCVMFRNPGATIKLAMKRFKEELSGNGIFNRGGGIGYYRIVEAFVTHGNCINYYDIDKIENSAFAIPLNIQKQIKGETTMGWTGFVIKMKDGKYFGFGSKLSFSFFQMPDGYNVNDIDEVINHSYTTKNGELRSHQEAFSKRPEDYSYDLIYKDRPYFECYIDSL